MIVVFDHRTSVRSLVQDDKGEVLMFETLAEARQHIQTMCPSGLVLVSLGHITEALANVERYTVAIRKGVEACDV